MSWTSGQGSFEPPHSYKTWPLRGGASPPYWKQSSRWHLHLKEAYNLILKYDSKKWGGSPLNPT